MTRLEQQIAQAIHADRWSLSSHADDRLEERGIEPWQIVAGFDDGRTILVDPDARPNPKLLRQQVLADGQNVVVVWAYERRHRVAKIVTVYFENA